MGGFSTIVDTVVTSPRVFVAAANADISICESTVENCTFRSMAVGITVSFSVG